ncbi:MAG: poly(R)-hydroxyalkanoic acid synthase subunit PhaE, partial [Pseudomonadota bacterium]
ADDRAEALMGRLWREGARAFAAMAASAATSAEKAGEPPRLDALWQGWTRFLEAMAEARAASAEARDAGPFDPAGWLSGPGEGGMADLWRWLEGPGFADVLAEERRLIRETREYIQYHAALEQYRIVMGQAWLRAFRAFAERLAEDGHPAGTGPENDPDSDPDPDVSSAKDPSTSGHARAEDAPSWDRLVALWREAADAEIARVQLSDDFVAAQRDLASAHLALSASIRDRVERVAQALGLPTRAEVDDLAAGMHAMQREVRNLKRLLREAGLGPGGIMGAAPPPGSRPS